MGRTIRSTGFKGTSLSSKFFYNLNRILLEKLKEVTRSTNLLIIGNFNAPSVNCADKNDSSLLLLGQFENHSRLVNRTVLGQVVNCFDLVFTKRYKINSLLTEGYHWAITNT